LLIVGPLPPPFGGVGVQVESIRRSPLAAEWTIEIFDTSKPQQQGKPSSVTGWDIVWTIWHLVALPFRLLARRPAVALVEATADTGYFRDVALALLCRALLVPVVFHWHGAPDSPQFPGSGWRRRFFRFGVGLAERFVVLADSYAPFFAAHVPAEKLAVVPNFLDGARFASSPRPVSERVRFLFVGRVGPLKGTDVLLEALARARTLDPGIEAVLVGDGESESALAEARRHPLVEAGVVTLAGRLGDERIGEYRRADAFVLPTRSESFPLAVVEAMAAGLPVIASDVGAIRWMVDGGRCGLLVPPGDATALQAAITRLAGDPALRRMLGERALERQAARFDERVAWVGWDSVLQEARGVRASHADAPAPGEPPAAANGGGVENSWTRT
jgi:glycosyltransferase involved in cell wall biosynthesis